MTPGEPLTAEVAGIRTSYHDVGEGPTIVFLHGSGPGVSAWSNWRLALPALSDRFRVVAPDLVGFGGTDPSQTGSYQRQLWIDHVVAFLDLLGIQSTHIVGNSFGGGLGLRLAIEHPERVDRLVAMGSIGMNFDLTEGLDLAWGYTPTRENMERLLEKFAYDRSLITDELIEMRYRASLQPGVQQAFAAMFPAPRQRWIDALASTDDELAAIRHQTLLIHGRDDQIIPLANSIRLLELIDRSQLHVFGRSGHWVQIEHADAFNHLLRSFFS